MKAPASGRVSVPNVETVGARGENPIRLRLYIAGATPNSQRAEINLQAAVQEMLCRSVCQIEIIDVLAEPKRAVTESVIVTPTLVALGSKRHCIVIGDLSDAEKLRVFLKTATRAG